MTTFDHSSDADDDITSVYHTYRRPILAHLVRLVGEQETAEDLCQETFIKAIRGWPQRNQDASIAAWLYRIATNTAYDYLRRGRRVRFLHLDTAEHMPTGAPSLETCMDEGEPVQCALAQMPEHYRAALVLHACAGHTMHEIAIKLGCSDNAVKTRLFRARARFREVYRG